MILTDDDIATGGQNFSRYARRRRSYIEAYIPVTLETAALLAALTHLYPPEALRPSVLMGLSSFAA
jgi:hypothetical protein